MKTLHVVLSASLATLSACSDLSAVAPVETPAGYWEGKGTAWELMKKTDHIELTRTAKTEFWFTVDSQGEGCGEIEVTYDANLIVRDLPSAQGPVTIAVEVGGELTDKDPTRRFPICVLHANGQLQIALATMPDERGTLEFTVTGKAAIGALFPTVINTGTTVKKDAQIKFPIAPMDPFLGPAVAAKRPNGPFAARFEEKTDKYTVEWSARQLRADDDSAARTRQMEDALQRLRQDLAARR